MSVKINHYAKPIMTNVRSFVEAGFIEFFVGIICAVFAYFTYNEILILFVSTSLIAVVCGLLTIYNIYVVIQDIRWQAKQKPR